MSSGREAHEIAARILEGVFLPPPTFEHEGLSHTVEEYVRLPKEFHDRGTRLAPIQIIAHAEKLGARAIIYSGQWEKFVTHERGFGLVENPAPKEDVWYQSTGTLRCHPSVEARDAPQIAASWLGTICSIVQERDPTEAERQKLLAEHVPLEQVGFFHARALGVRPKWHLFKRQGKQ